MDEFTKFRLKKLQEKTLGLKDKANLQGKDLEDLKRKVEAIKERYGFNEPLLEDPMASEFTKFKNKKAREAESLERIKDLYYRDPKAPEQAPKLTEEELNLNPSLNDLEKHRITKEAQAQRQQFKDEGLDLDYSKPIPPDSEVSDPRSSEYNRKAVVEDYLPEGHNVDRWEKYWKDVGYEANPTWNEWNRAKQFELGTPSEPILPSLAQLGLALGAQKALEIPEAGKDADVIPEDEQLDRRFKKLKTILENK